MAARTVFAVMLIAIFRFNMNKLFSHRTDGVEPRFIGGGKKIL
jgi:hypothetical protein